MKTKEEIEILTADATSGDEQAQLILGLAYASGDGMPKDFEKAFKWLTKAANHQNKNACFELGRLYESGKGTKMDYEEAVKWYEKASELGDNAANVFLGHIYENGTSPLSVHNESIKPFEPDPEQAFYWYTQAHLAGYFDVARCLELGIGTPKNLLKAVRIYRKINSRQADERLNKLLEEFNPEQESRLDHIELFKLNPYRALGTFANSTHREIKSNIAKIEAYRKVGKDISFPLDSYLLSPGNYKIEPVNRDSESVSNAVSSLENEETKILYSLFWFHDETEEDHKAFDLIKQGKPQEAKAIWSSASSYSGAINLSLLSWNSALDNAALVYLLKFLNDDKLRESFLSSINISPNKYSLKDLKIILWKGLFSKFPKHERDFEVFYIANLIYSGTLLPNSNLIDYSDLDFIITKEVEEIYEPLSVLLSNARYREGNDFEAERKSHEQLFEKAKKILKRVERYVGREDNQYVKISDEIALELLEFAIAYNNDCNDLNAPSVALQFAKQADSFAISEVLRNRCQKNIQIFEENKLIAETDETLLMIDKKLNEQESGTLTFQKIETMISEAQSYLSKLQSLIGITDPLYLKVSSGVVNRILNAIIKVSNIQSDYNAYSKATTLMKTMEAYEMDEETHERFERNNKILTRNLNVTSRSEFLGPHSFSHETQGRTQPYRERKYSSSQSHAEVKNSNKSPKELTEHRWFNKAFATVFALVALCITVFYLNYKNTWEYFIHAQPWWMYTCVGFVVFLVLFIILTWGLEYQEDPYDPSCKWMKECSFSFEDITELLTDRQNERLRLPLLPIVLLYSVFSILMYIIRGILIGISWIVTKL